MKSNPRQKLLENTNSLNQIMYDVTVIGGGFYGCMIAIHFKGLGKKVLLLEREPDIMKRASFNNQARVHNGYHYPRAVMTAMSSHRNYARFVEEFSPSVKDSYLMTYLIAKGSKTNPDSFEALYKRIGSPLNPPSEKVMKLINQDLIQSAYTVEERVFDGDILRSIIWHRLFELGVDVVCNAEALRVSEGKILVNTLNEKKEKVVESKRIINCSYAGINKLLTSSGLPEVPIRMENTVMPLIKVPREFRDLGVTIMDGYFFAVMPFPPLSLHTIHHVKLTPAKGEHEEEIIADAIRFIPCLSKAEHKGSIKEVKVLLTQNNRDDGRPSLFKKDYGFRGLDVVMGGKLDNIYEIMSMLDGEENEDLNIVI